MSELRERDVRSALDFAYEAGALTGPDPFPHEFLEGLMRLIPADAIVGYHEVVIGSRCRLIEFVEVPSDPIPSHIEEAAQPLCYQDPLTYGRCRSERRR